MNRIIRSSQIQARVFPPIKDASERVLWRIGLNMSEAMELFLRRVIVDEKLPFEVVALDEAVLKERNIDQRHTQKPKALTARKASRPPR